MLSSTRIFVLFGEGNACTHTLFLHTSCPDNRTNASDFLVTVHTLRLLLNGVPHNNIIYYEVIPLNSFERNEPSFVGSAESNLSVRCAVQKINSWKNVNKRGTKAK
jgi:hypothetical protein